MAPTESAWKVMGDAPPTKSGKACVRVVCPFCQQDLVRRVDAVRKSKACKACTTTRRNRARTRHGQSKSAVYRLWHGIRARCTNTEHPLYALYGARGIGVAAEWDCREGFTRFAEALGPRPSTRHSVDRIDNAQGYVPGNVRWATHEEQARNRSGVYRIEHRGQLLTLSELSLATGISLSSLSYYARRGRLEARLAVDGRKRDQDGVRAARRALRSAINRCNNPQAEQYRNYGGRGIRVATAWLDPEQGFSAFLQHIGPRPSPAYSLDRIDTNGGYEPGNVRWASSHQQARNTRASRYLVHQGESLLLTEWAARKNLPPTTLARRLNCGWSVERALETPARSRT
jgi:hypothetical protein